MAAVAAVTSALGHAQVLKVLAVLGHAVCGVHAAAHAVGTVAAAPGLAELLGIVLIFVVHIHLLDDEITVVGYCCVRPWGVLLLPTYVKNKIGPVCGICQ